MTPDPTADPDPTTSPRELRVEHDPPRWFVDEEEVSEERYQEASRQMWMAAAAAAARTDWQPSDRYEVKERWLDRGRVRQVGVWDKMTGQQISLTVFYEGP